MSPEQWKQVESALARPWGSVKLRVDGYDLVLAVQQRKPLHFVIAPYINGSFRGEWLLRVDGAWTEEARRFLPSCRRRLFSAVGLTRAIRRAGHAGKRVAQDLRQETFESRGWYWSSFGALKRHLIAHNTSIELVEPKP